MKRLSLELKNLCRAVVFLGLAGVILFGANFVLKLKAADGCYPAQMFQRQEPDSVDVVFIGSSHIYTDVNPAVLWTEYGIASYNLAGSNQPLWNTYHYMKEAVEKQSPRLIVIDLYRATETRDFIDDARIAMNTLGLSDGKNKIDNIYASVEKPEDALSYILQYPVYHTRYEALEENDFKRYNGDVNGENYKGFNINCISTTVFEAFADHSGVDERTPLTKKNEKYLKKIIELAEETDTELLLMVAPYQGITDSDKKIFNEAEAIAREYGASYVDFNEHYESIGLDPARDCAEYSHLNYYGSEKFSKYLGKYIKNRYDIPDQRGDEKYVSWDKNAEYYEKIAYNFRLRNTEDLEEYLDVLLANKDYTVCISIEEDYGAGGMDVAALLQEKGIYASYDGVIVLDRGETVFYADRYQAEGYEYHMDIGSKTLVINGIPREETDTVTGETKKYIEKKIAVGEADGITVGYGINIILYDNYTESFLDTFGFNALDGYKKFRL